MVIAYGMARELPRTLRSLGPGMQRGCAPDDYEVIVVDNGSTPPVADLRLDAPPMALSVVRIEPSEAGVSPVGAAARGLAAARGELVGLMIDGARLASPGLVAGALQARRLAERPVVLTLGFHLGPKVQMQSVREGYDQALEDRLLEDIRWWEDGYRLFDVSVLAGSSSRGWFQPINESNAIFMPGPMWAELGGLEPRFASPGGGYVNMDLLRRAVALPRATAVTLLGEATFHQVHGGVATNALDDPHPLFSAEYRAIRGGAFTTPAYDSLYVGRLGPGARRTLGQGL